MKPRRILIHMYECIWPPNCGVHMRVWQVIDSLRSLGFDVSLCAAQGRLPQRMHWSADAIRHLEKRDISVHLSDHGVGSLDFWWSAAVYTARKKFGRSRFWRPDSLYFCRPQLERKWANLIRSMCVEHVIVNYCYWHRLCGIARTQHASSSIDMIDLLSEQFVATSVRLGATTPNEKELGDFERVEETSLARADSVFAINPEEGNRVRRAIATPVFDVPFCLQDPGEGTLVAPEDECDILVIGSGIEHNKAGLREFLRESWPVLKVQIPSIRLTVCGGVGEGLVPDPNITCHARVPDLGPKYRGAKIVLLTTISGAGIKIKAIEALSYGSCIVAHQASVKGIPFVDGEHGVVLNGFHNTAEVFLRLLRSSERRTSLGNQAKVLFQRCYELSRGREAIATALGVGIV